MADKIVVLNAGQIEQYGSPLELYERPANLFVAGFIGSPKMNFVPGEAAGEPGVATLGIRPEHLRIGKEGEGGWPGTVSVAEHLGSDTFLYVAVDGAGDLTVRTPGEFGIKPGQPVFLTPELGQVHRFEPRDRHVGIAAAGAGFRAARRDEGGRGERRGGERDRPKASRPRDAGHRAPASAIALSSASRSSPATVRSRLPCLSYTTTKGRLGTSAR